MLLGWEQVGDSEVLELKLWMNLTDARGDAEEGEASGQGS